MYSKNHTNGCNPEFGASVEVFAVAAILGMMVDLEPGVKNTGLVTKLYSSVSMAMCVHTLRVGYSSLHRKSAVHVVSGFRTYFGRTNQSSPTPKNSPKQCALRFAQTICAKKQALN